MTERIHWIVTRYGGYTGHVGALEPWLFQLWHCEDCSGEWSLMVSLPGCHSSDHVTGDDIASLKRDAEKILENFIASLGASFSPGDVIPGGTSGSEDTR